MTFPTYNNSDPENRFWWRVVFDDLYFLILVVIMLAIVSGIIIDAFGASRDHRHGRCSDLRVQVQCDEKWLAQSHASGEF